ncbi:AgmX/PglI C-terminal domain-containing protein [Anaeromyxobacter oryzae]|uniref:Zinc finger/thioredoxin putative domain-containing protein n=1 Tax=Anaeromyxobacter oryzae TaxID=2918170 RepID=A0ABN6MWG1_9BACT|nr:AgmX/PglI C-terminal domain-containing protein [Anaeromyxobacter oryzae]BDG05334.1 hypothetical protein AMOR_43300 [Anaeromyxobacter oryzae]
MKFSCERCGKKYATADKPVPGRVYKLKCKACGHLIVVKGAAATSAATPATSTAAPSAREIGSDARAPEPFVPVTSPTPTPTNGVALAATTELSLSRAEASQESSARTPPPVASVTPLPFPAPTPVPFAAPPAALEPDPDFAPPPGDTGYVDLFADSPATAGAEAEPEAEAAVPQAEPLDPFLAAARSSLPETFGGPAADPFAPIRAELDAAAAADARAAHPEDTSPPLAPPKVPDIPRPPPRKQGIPFALIGAGVLVMIGILVFALMGGKKTAPAAAPPPVATAVVPAPAPPPAPAPEPVVEKAPEPVAAAPEPEPAPAPAPKAEPPPKPARVERAPERQREPARRAERKIEPKPEKVVAAAPQPAPATQPAAAPEPPPRQEAKVDLPDVSEGLSQDQIQKVLASTRKAFDNCIATAGKDSDLPLDGRKVALRLNIQPNGSVTYPTLDDVQLNATALGACLKSAARLMVFPKFKGDPVRIEVPLTLSSR